jgi:hypothetical protein
MPKRLTCFLLAFFLVFSFSPVPLPAFEPSPGDRELLNKIEKDTFQYFIRFSDKNTGLTRDSSRPGAPSSIAATGFALAAYALGASRGWIESEDAYERILKTLKFLKREAAHEEGFFYHFLDPRTGERSWASEASSIDTALLIAGALLAAQYYPGTEIERLTQEIYDWFGFRLHGLETRIGIPSLLLGRLQRTDVPSSSGHRLRDLSHSSQSLGQVASPRRRVQWPPNRLLLFGLSFYLPVLTSFYRLPESGRQWY